MKNYIFAYGSLIEKESRLRTTPNAKNAFPVKVQGFQRGWFTKLKTIGFTTTFLGCIQNKKHCTNGVVYEVTEDELAKTDVREKGYQRIKIDIKNIDDFTSQIDKQANIWIYANTFPNNIVPQSELPSKDTPIVQSYVDICLNGCLEIEELYPEIPKGEFAKDFIKSTSYWSNFWVNDRIFPRRPFIYCPNAYKIDQLLKENLPDKTIFDNIYFE